MGESLGVGVGAMEDHGHQANLAQGIELGPGTAGTDSFSSPNEPKGCYLLRLAVLKHPEVLGFQIIDRVALLVADHHVEQNFLARRLDGTSSLDRSLDLLAVDRRR